MAPIPCGAFTELEARVAALERAAGAHDRMMAVLVHGGDVGDVAAIVTDLLGGTLCVLDAEGRRIASAGVPPVPLGDEEIAGVWDSARSARAQGRAVRRGDLWVAPVSADEAMLGALVLQTSDEVSDADRRILERAALVTALLLRRHVTRDEEAPPGGPSGRDEPLDDLLDDLLSGRHGGAEALTVRARRMNVDLDSPHAVLCARYERDDLRRRAAAWASSFAAVRRGLAASRPGEIVLVLPEDRPGDLARRVAGELGARLGGPATVGAAGPVRGPAEITAAYRDARRCADALRTLGRTGDGASAAELGVVGLLMGEDQDLGGLLTHVIGPVLDHDARCGTALVRTLDAYFRAGGSLAKAAELLRIHVTTVARRLERVSRLIGEDWHTPERALELQLALRLHRLTH